MAALLVGGALSIASAAHADELIDTVFLANGGRVRGSVMVEKSKDYVAAAQLIGLPASKIMLRHVLPNTMGPILVIATINLGLAVITEATLSFLGAGMPDTMPSLGTLIRIGNNYLFAGEWWIVAFPGLALASLILSINLLGDWLRDAINPKLR